MVPGPIAYIASASYLIGTVCVLALVYSPIESPLAFLVRALHLQLSIAMCLAALCLLALTQLKMGLRVAHLIIWLPMLPPLFAQHEPGNPSTDSPESARIATFSGMTRTRNETDLAIFLEQHQPDIACLQEFPINDAFDLAISGYFASTPDESNLRVISKSPVIVLAKNSRVLTTTTKLFNEPVNVVNVHMDRQYRPGSGSTWDSLSAAGSSGSRSVLCGDFNMTPYNLSYKMITEDLAFNDAHSQAGTGFGLTFPASERRISILGTMLRLDYIFHRGFQSVKTSVIKASEESDHLAVVTDLLEAES